MFEKLLDIFIPKTQTPAQKREFVGKFAGKLGILFNLVLCIFKVVAGVISGSVSIIADAVNNLFDALTSGITVVCFRLSGKPADKDHPYGHERMEYVVTLFLSFFVMFIGYEFIKTSVGRILHPEETKLTTLVVVLLSVAIVAKLFMAKMYNEYAKMIDSPMLKAASKDSLNDTVSTGGVLLANIVAVAFGVPIDGYVGLLVSMYIIYSGLGIVKDAVDPILGCAPDEEFIDSIGKIVVSYDEVIDIHDLMVHSYGPNKIFASVHAEVDAKADIMASHDVIDNIEKDVYEKTGVSLVIHMDPIVIDDERVNHARDTVSAIVKELDSCLSIHDFRMVIGNTHTNLIFDIVLPFEYKDKVDHLLEGIREKVWDVLGKEYFCVIEVDYNN